MHAPSRLALAGLAALLALLLCCPPAAAQTMPLPLSHDFTVEGAALTLLQLGNTSRMETGHLCAGQPGGPPGPLSMLSQGPDVFRFDQEGNSFTFDEATSDDPNALATPYTGCGGVFYNVTLPSPATRLFLNFTVDRLVRPDLGVDALPGTPPSFTQEFRLYFPDGSSRVTPYFAPRDGNQAPIAITTEFAIAPPADTLTLEWYFRDDGALGVSQQGDVGRARMTSVVRDIQVRFEGIPLPMPDLGQSGAESLDEEARTGTLQHWANVTVPPGAVGDRRTSEVILEIRRGPSLQERIGPGGPVSSERFEASRIGDRVQYVIDGQSVAEQGPGAYSFRFSTTRAVPIPSPPGSPTTIEPFYYLMVLLPAPAALLALFSAIAYRREAEGRYRRASGGILAVIIIGLVYYILLFVYAVFGAGRDVMSTLPLDDEATLTYAQFILLLLFFVAFAVVVGRYLVTGMRRDLEARRLQEEKLRRSNEELERFAYVASHDLQEPLRKVAGFTSLLQRRYKGRLDKDADEMIQYAVDGATRMQALIRDILAYSRVGSSELDLRAVDAGALMELVVADLGVKIKEEKALVSWDDLPTVEADAGQLRQVLQNLVENALKYRDPKRRPRIQVAAEPDGPMWRFMVTDNGLGIPADKLTDVFGIFRRLHGADVPGTGIGLALAKKAVERHGGRIWAASRIGRGSTFFFTLPAESRAAPRGARLWGLRAATEEPGPEADVDGKPGAAAADVA